MDLSIDFKDIKGILRRRKRIFWVIFLLIFPLVAALAFILPPLYQSHATIVIEGQQVSDDYIKTPFAGYAEERLQKATRQVMNRKNLREIVTLFNLYPKMQERGMMGDAVDKLMQNINIQDVKSYSVDKRTGRETDSTIAFIVSFEGEDPQTVRDVTHALSLLYIELEKTEKEKINTATASFFEEELQNLKDQILIYEERIKKFKEDHPGELPEFHKMNLQHLERWEKDLDRVSIRIRSLEERLFYLKSQIVAVDPLTPIKTGQGRVAMNPMSRLKALRLELLNLQSTLSDKHPDVKRLKRQIAELEAQLGDSDDSVVKIKRLTQLETDLSVMKGNLGANHPDVKKLSREVALLTEEVEKMLIEQAVTKVEEEKADNPVYINLSVQIVNTTSEINGLQEEKTKILEKIEEYQRKVDMNPIIEKQYNEITRDYQTAKHKYNELSNQRLEAKIARGVLETQRGERFILTEPAYLPEQPHKPNRKLIILFGLIAAVGLGTFMVAAAEGLDDSIKTPGEVAAIAGVSVLSMISFIETKEEITKRKRRRVAFASAGVFAVILLLVMVDTLIIPLDELWLNVNTYATVAWERLHQKLTTL
jgi:uncharacterized protein involved in exopolysaccharide biosynthesis